MSRSGRLRAVRDDVLLMQELTGRVLGNWLARYES
jgi:hypothetical protein